MGDASIATSDATARTLLLRPTSCHCDSGACAAALVTAEAQAEADGEDADEDGEDDEDVPLALRSARFASVIKRVISPCMASIK